MTQDLLPKINLRDRLFKLQVLEHTDENKEQYRVIRNGLSNFPREAKKRYFSYKFKEAEGNSLKT